MTVSQSASRRAFLLCAALELPLLTTLIWLQGSAQHSLFFKILLWYHVVPLTITSFVWLWCFGHGSPSIGPLASWHALTWCLIFFLQTLLLWSVARLLFRRHGLDELDYRGPLRS